MEYEPVGRTGEQGGNQQNSEVPLDTWRWLREMPEQSTSLPMEIAHRHGISVTLGEPAPLESPTIIHLLLDLLQAIFQRIQWSLVSLCMFTLVAHTCVHNDNNASCVWPSNGNSKTEKRVFISHVMDALGNGKLPLLLTEAWMRICDAIWELYANIIFQIKKK